MQAPADGGDATACTCLSLEGDAVAIPAGLQSSAVANTESVPRCNLTNQLLHGQYLTLCI